MAASDRLCVGAISGVRGVRGEIRIKPFTDNPKDVAAYGPVETEDGSRRFRLTHVKVGSQGVSARAEGINSREEAEALKGTRLYVSRDALPEPDEDNEFYVTDLIGLHVEQKEKGQVGIVEAVQDYGAGDLLEIRLKETGKTVFVPFTQDVVPEVNIKAGYILIDPPGGLFDDGSKGPDEEEEGDEQ